MKFFVFSAAVNLDLRRSRRLQQGLTSECIDLSEDWNERTFYKRSNYLCVKFLLFHFRTIMVTFSYLNIATAVVNTGFIRSSKTFVPLKHKFLAERWYDASNKFLLGDILVSLTGNFGIGREEVLEGAWRTHAG